MWSSQQRSLANKNALDTAMKVNCNDQQFPVLGMAHAPETTALGKLTQAKLTHYGPSPKAVKPIGTWQQPQASLCLTQPIWKTFKISGHLKPNAASKPRSPLSFPKKTWTSGESTQRYTKASKLMRGSKLGDVGCRYKVRCCVRSLSWAKILI